jgi:hypothetical protein
MQCCSLTIDALGWRGISAFWQEFKGHRATLSTSLWQVAQGSETCAQIGTWERRSEVIIQFKRFARVTVFFWAAGGTMAGMESSQRL